MRNVVVAPTARRRGIGRALMRAAAEALRARGKASWRLEVDPANSAAIALYEGMGMRARYVATVLRFPWVAAALLPEATATAGGLVPEGDAEIEALF